MRNIQNIYSHLSSTAKNRNGKEEMKANHISGIVLGGKLLSIGHNQNNRSCYNKKIVNSIHSEIDAVFKYLSIIGKKRHGTSFHKNNKPRKKREIC